MTHTHAHARTHIFIHAHRARARARPRERERERESERARARERKWGGRVTGRNRRVGDGKRKRGSETEIMALCSAHCKWGEGRDVRQGPDCDDAADP